MESYERYTEREADEERREEQREREARFLPEEYLMWDYFTPEGDNDANTDLRSMPDDHALRKE